MRYFLATKLSNGIDDLDLDLLDFQKKVNTDLVGKFVNIASRSQGFLKEFNNILSNDLDENLIDEFSNKKNEIFNHYLDRNYSKALKEIMTLADKANQYIDSNKPWILNKESSNKEKVRKIASTAIVDLSNNSYAGISDTTTLNFTTGSRPTNPLDDKDVVLSLIHI